MREKTLLCDKPYINMTIVLAIYAISWLILFVVYLRRDRGDTRAAFLFTPKWFKVYMSFIFIFLAPLVVLLIPYLLYEQYIDNKQAAKTEAEREAKEQRENEKREQILSAFYAHCKDFAYHAEYADMGAALHELARTKQYDKLLMCLDRVKLPHGLSLYVREAEQRDMGDRSYITAIDDSDNSQYALFEKLIVEDSCMGAWQAYMLESLWHVLPLYWHALYEERIYTFSFNDFSKLSELDDGTEKAERLRNSFGNEHIQPIVGKNGGKYYVSACFWTEYGGLLRETCEVEIRNNKLVDIQDIGHKTIYEYQSSIVY